MARVNPSQNLLKKYWSKGYQFVVGVDEVGRGSLAGPVTVAAVLLPHKARLPGVRDSKQLTLNQREKLAVKIKKTAIAFSIGWASHEEIDQEGLTKALKLGAKRALKDLAVQHRIDFIILDGKHNYLPKKYLSQAIIRSDEFCLPVSCASIIAKVARDQYMRRQHILYPEFGFESNVGYGTAEHRAKIAEKHSPIHRRSFAPLKKNI